MNVTNTRRECGAAARGISVPRTLPVVDKASVQYHHFTLDLTPAMDEEHRAIMAWKGNQNMMTKALFQFFAGLRD